MGTVEGLFVVGYEGAVEEEARGGGLGNVDICAKQTEANPNHNAEKQNK